jgi:hypothetical protein
VFLEQASPVKKEVGWVEPHSRFSLISILNPQVTHFSDIIFSDFDFDSYRMLNFFFKQEKSNFWHGFLYSNELGQIPYSRQNFFN